MLAYRVGNWISKQKKGRKDRAKEKAGPDPTSRALAAGTTGHAYRECGCEPPNPYNDEPKEQVIRTDYKASMAQIVALCSR